MENLNLIHKIAWSFSRTTGLDPDDLFQEAAVGYLEALRTYDPARGKLTTHAWHCIQSRLKNYVKQEIKYTTPLVDIEKVFTKQAPPYGKLFEWLSREGQEIASLIIEHPEEYDLVEPCEAVRQVGQVAHPRGMPWKRIWIGGR